MTKKVLRIDSSIFGEQGVSSRLNRELIIALQKQLGPITLTHRNLALDSLPHFSADFIAALSKKPEKRSQEENQWVQLADTLIEEVLASDILVVAAPMYNFGVPSTLKAWIDYIARAGVTFQYTDKGSEGLVKGKTLYLTTSRGGVYRDQPSDHEVPYLKSFFEFIGITDVRVVYAEGVNIGLAESAFTQAVTDIGALVSIGVSTGVSAGSTR